MNTDFVSKITYESECKEVPLYDLDIKIYEDFVNYVYSIGGEIVCDPNCKKQLVESEINGEDKLIYLGSFNIKTKNLTFKHCSSFVDIKEERIISECFIKKEDLNKFFEFKEDFKLYLNKGKITSSGGVVFVGEKFDKKNLINPNKVDEVKTVIDNFFSSKEKYKENNLQYLRSLVISGDVGSGKTTLVKSLSKELNYNFYLISPGSADEVIANTIMEAEQNSPSIVCLDYFDDWCGVVNPFMIRDLLDTSEPDNGVLFLITCTKKSKVFPSLVGRKRLIKEFELKLPDDKCIKEYFKEFDISEKMFKFLNQEFKTNNLMWIGLEVIRNELKLSKFESGDSFDVDKELKKIVQSIVKETKENKNQVNVNKYFEEESEDK